MLLVVDDPEQAVARAKAAGATEVYPVADAHGWRLGRIEDPFGHHWEIGKPLIPWPPPGGRPGTALGELRLDGGELAARGGDVAAAGQAHRRRQPRRSSTCLNAAIASRDEPSYIPVGLYGIRLTLNDVAVEQGGELRGVLGRSR